MLQKIFVVMILLCVRISLAQTTETVKLYNDENSPDAFLVIFDPSMQLPPPPGKVVLSKTFQPQFVVWKNGRIILKDGDSDFYAYREYKASKSFATSLYNDFVSSASAITITRSLPFHPVTFSAVWRDDKGQGFGRGVLITEYRKLSANPADPSASLEARALYALLEGMKARTQTLGKGIKKQIVWE